jgi:hypothetical protein
MFNPLMIRLVAPADPPEATKLSVIVAALALVLQIKMFFTIVLVLAGAV